MCPNCVENLCSNRCDLEVVQIPETPYQVSSCGMVWKLEDGELFRQKTYLQGTLYVDMWHFGGKLKVAHLVMRAFGIYGGGKILYKDDNPENCNKENLSWSRSLKEEIARAQKRLDLLKGQLTV